MIQPQNTVRLYNSDIGDIIRIDVSDNDFIEECLINGYLEV